jgi:hypothetical protein
MGEAVYLLGTLTSLCCSFLLFRAYSRVKKKLLFWSGLCFAGLTVSNFLVFLDLVIYPDVNLYRLRLAAVSGARPEILFSWPSRLHLS